MNILTEYSFLSDRQIETIENRHCPKCMFESQLKLRSDKWGDYSSVVLYAAKPHPEGSNWYGIRDNAVQFVISNAISAVEKPFFGVLAENDDVIYSRHRHDFRESGDKTAFIDRGRGRPRHDLIHEVIKLKVFKERVVAVPRENCIAFCEVPFTQELGWSIN